MRINSALIYRDTSAPVIFWGRFIEMNRNWMYWQRRFLLLFCANYGMFHTNVTWIENVMLCMTVNRTSTTVWLSSFMKIKFIIEIYFHFKCRLSWQILFYCTMWNVSVWGYARSRWHRKNRRITRNQRVVNVKYIKYKTESQECT